MALYFGTCGLAERMRGGTSYSRPEPLYYWGYYAGMNAPWAVVPGREYLPSFLPYPTLFGCHCCVWLCVCLARGHGYLEILTVFWIMMGLTTVIETIVLLYQSARAIRGAFAVAGAGHAERMVEGKKRR